MSLIACKASGLSKEEMRAWDYIRMHDSVTRLDIESLLGVDSKKTVRVLNKRQSRADFGFGVGDKIRSQPINFLFISLMQEKRNQRVHYPQGPLHRGMQLIPCRDRTTSEFWYRSQSLCPKGRAMIV